MTHADRMHFEEHGFVILRNLASSDVVERMLKATEIGRKKAIPPVEFEADLQYPGSPASQLDPGGKTIRRLKQAHSRGIVFTEWLTFPPLRESLKQLLGPALVCPFAHHNCIMTKEPEFSSETGWHQDIRYWSYSRPELVSMWLALRPENKDNGCLQLVPGTHRMTFGQHQFDSELFFRDDLKENQALIEQRVYAELEPGDVLLFHCRTLHAASRNRTDKTKYSVVFTFRPLDNPPTPNSRSAASPELLIH
ncbi:phytanoyl-CoA dioxygenase family protein [Thalassoglobus sp.]|uniref:phytanoyl-CoA dioxygenase family protein n=1 Tax=Thalassoglobus sp. TaxID=2795869 RepID=UPI003AA8EE6A